MTADVRNAYIASAEAWSQGPERVFAAMADALVARCPLPLRGASALDVGTGSGVVARAFARAGAHVTVIDDALAMVALARTHASGRATVADVRALPVRRGAVDIAGAGFVLNHLTDPSAALRGLGRAVRKDGAIVASTWARGDEHPVKQATEHALLRRGWQRPAWYARLKEQTTPLSDTAALLAAAAEAAGLVDVNAQVVPVRIDGLPVDAMIAWRTNLPPNAPFVGALGDDERRRLVDEVRTALGPDVAPLQLQMVALTSRVAA